MTSALVRGRTLSQEAVDLAHTKTEKHLFDLLNRAKNDPGNDKVKRELKWKWGIIYDD